LRLLVTGATGFLGAQVVPELERRGHDVVGVGRRDGDLAEPGSAERLLDAHAPDAVVHLAAVVGRLVGDEDPAATIRANVTAAALVARACATRPTRLAYGSTTDVTAPQNLYAWTKRWGEEATLLFVPDALLLRIGMPYGPGKGAIPNMLRQALARERIPVHRGEVRSWCWAGDTAAAIARLLESGSEGAWNVARDDDPRTMREAAELACRLTDAPADLIDEIEPPHGSAPQVVSSEPLRALGWSPQVELDEGMRRVLTSMAPR